MIHAIITTKYQKYPSITILKYVNVLAKVNNSPQGSLLNMTPHDNYSITIHVRTMTISEISHEQKNKIPLSIKQYIKEQNTVAMMTNLYVPFKQ